MALTEQEKTRYIAQRSANDMHLRSKIGPAFYLLSLLVISFTDNFVERYPWELAIAVGVFTVIAIVRLTATKPPADEVGVARWRRKSQFLMLITAVSWGTWFCWVVLHPQLENVFVVTLVCTVALATAAAHQFCIEPLYGKIAYLVIVLPAAVLIFIARPDILMLGYVLIIYCIYLIMTSIRSHREYYSGFKTEIGLLDAQQALHDLSNTDELTRLPNRRSYQTFLDDAFSTAKAQQSNLVVMIVDVDYFKAINDNYGHITGDICLQKIADILSNHFTQAGQHVARIGGEEFSVILVDTSLEQGLALAKQCHEKIDKTKVEAQSQTIDIAVSIGVASYKAQLDSTPSDLIRRADNMLFKAKDAGRNCVKY